MDLIKTARQLVDRALLVLGITVFRPADDIATYSRSDLITRVLKKLQVIGDGDSATAEEAANLSPIIDSVVATLNQRGVVSITDTANFLKWQFEPLADIIAFAHAADHGKAGNAAYAQLASAGESLLKTITRIARVDEFVDGFLEDLTAREIVYVPEPDAIPIAVFESLARLLALNVATVFEQPRDEAAILLAENRIRVATSSRPTFERMQAEYF